MTYLSTPPSRLSTIATNLEDSLAHLAALYDRRMAIEEQIRDTKGARFGLKLVWTQIKTPQALARFTLLIGLAVLLLTAIGYAMAPADPIYDSLLKPKVIAYPSLLAEPCLPKRRAL